MYFIYYFIHCNKTIEQLNDSQNIFVYEEALFFQENIDKTSQPMSQRSRGLS